MASFLLLDSEDSSAPLSHQARFSEATKFDRTDRDALSLSLLLTTRTLCGIQRSSLRDVNSSSGHRRWRTAMADKAPLVTACRGFALSCGQPPYVKRALVRLADEAGLVSTNPCSFQVADQLNNIRPPSGRRGDVFAMTR